MKTTDAQLIISIQMRAWGFPRKTCHGILIAFTEWIRRVAGPKEGLVCSLAIAKETVKQHKGFIWPRVNMARIYFTIVLPYDKDAIKDDWIQKRKNKELQ